MKTHPNALLLLLIGGAEAPIHFLLLAGRGAAAVADASLGVPSKDKG